MSDRLSLQDLPVWTRIGVTDEERAIEQRLLISLWFTIDTREAAKKDDVTASINYDIAAREVRKIATEKERKTIECLAQDIADGLLHIDSVDNVTVNIRKYIHESGTNACLTINRPWRAS